MRSTKEWMGKTDDAMPPPSVRLRVFKRHDGRCHLSGRKIRPGDAWDLDHVKPLWDGGENRESNMAPALTKPHRQKSAADQRAKAEADRKQMKTLGIRKLKGRPIPGSKRSGWKKKMDGTAERRP